MSPLASDAHMYQATATTSGRIKETKGGMKDDERPDRRGRIKLRIDRC